MRGHLLWFLFLISSIPWPTVDTQAAAARKMVAEVHSVGLVDFGTAEKIAAGIVSPEGKVLAEKEHNRLILYDYPEKQEALRQALATTKPYVQHVRIQAEVREEPSVATETPDIRLGGGPLQADQMKLTPASLLRQELIIISGGKSRIRIGGEVPYADWIWDYGIKHRFWTGSTRWKDVRAQMVVEPQALSGRKIRIRLVPEFRYVLKKEPVVSVLEKLAAEIVINSGEETDTRKMTLPDREFYSRFLTGYTHNGNKCPLKIVLQAALE